MITAKADLDRMIRRHVTKGKGVSNVLLQRLAKQVCSKDFRGVFAANRIPRALAGFPRFVIIVNLGEKAVNRPLKVGHFVCIAAEPNKKVRYVDPYGIPCMQPKVLRFLKETRRKLWENTQPVQAMSSAHCSLYALLFALYLDKRPRGLRLLFDSTDLEGNDKRCVNYLYRIILGKSAK